VSQGLRCKGDGERALRRGADLVVKDSHGALIDDARSRRVDEDEELPKDENDLVEINCPCPLLEAGMCGENAALMVLLPDVSMGGIYQISTGSFRNIVRINSAIDYIRSLIGRIALVRPLKLRRQEEVIEYEGKKAKHYLLQLHYAGTLEEAMRQRMDTQYVLTQTVPHLALPAPIEDGPDNAPGAIVVETEEEPEDDKDDPLRSATSAELKALADAAKAVDALVPDQHDPNKKAVLVSKEAGKLVRLEAGAYKPAGMTVNQIVALTGHYRQLKLGAADLGL
jgi:hypothetical protein